MKKILIIADGILAKQFLEKIMSIKGSENLYTILAYRDKTLPEEIYKKYDLHFFDPTSFSKLSKVFNQTRFYQVMIIMRKKDDAKNTYLNVRKISKDTHVYMVDRWGLKPFEDANLFVLQSKEHIASKFSDFLPDRPMIARNVGLGEGEIMQVQVPTGSSFLYRHLASIEQKQWRIVAIYRKNKLLLSRPTLMIRPGDILLLIGEPNILNNVYKSIKQESGQFPNPFGKNIYVLIDMKTMDKKRIDFILNDALILHSKLNNQKLYISIANPTSSSLFEHIKRYENSSIVVNIDYFKVDLSKVLLDDLSNFDIGLIISDDEFFEKYKTTLHEQKLPVLKIGKYGFSMVKSGVILASNGNDIERESSVILDFCSQLDLQINLYNFDPNENNDTKYIVDHFEHLSKLFEKDVAVIQDDKNPILKLKEEKDFIQFVPFNLKVVQNDMFNFFSTDMDKLSYKLKDNYQLFIPAEE